MEIRYTPESLEALPHALRQRLLAAMAAAGGAPCEGGAAASGFNRHGDSMAIPWRFHGFYMFYMILYDFIWFYVIVYEFYTSSTVQGSGGWLL